MATEEFNQLIATIAAAFFTEDQLDELMDAVVEADLEGGTKQ